MKTIYLAGGCFWGTEKFISQFKGVCSTEVGYANGKTENPTYSEVCHNDTGHAETVKVMYDDTIISTSKLLNYYFMSIDPTSLNKQGGDVGTQYRTGIYYEDDSLLPDIKSSVEKLEASINKKTVIEVKHLQNYYKAEDYHQKYLNKNPNGYCHIPLHLFNLEKNGESENG